MWEWCVRSTAIACSAIYLETFLRHFNFLGHLRDLSALPLPSSSTFLNISTSTPPSFSPGMSPFGSPTVAFSVSSLSLSVYSLLLFHIYCLRTSARLVLFGSIQVRLGSVRICFLSSDLPHSLPGVYHRVYHIDIFRICISLLRFLNALFTRAGGCRNIQISHANNAERWFG